MNETILTIVGNLAADPDLRYTKTGGIPVANFTVAQTLRRYDATTSEWVDGDTVWMPCTVWQDVAVNTAESLRKGDPVIVVGRLRQRSWEDENGGKRTRIEMEVTEMGPSLRWRQCTLRKITKEERA